jgi:hypothetical protein
LQIAPRVLVRRIELDRTAEMLDGLLARTA